ncbi:AfsR/SARP family transcriptional regulator [Amycolatopsis sp. H20-H5]|uniref:AfsR/SARP family transcriptional regulator n=1 Tax=Amycolatopsis sp. H20-H5 TaxID=3046309 RepID=UPI002DBCE915|nr:BTAD domain-containing putative transcriptional regulator [Amycolatopsis sp. H20-H5]MEC3974328.1 BTAD domain-containing putative transcriptional regulator [Amycolatopsis sp. H20-H5]
MATPTSDTERRLQAVLDNGSGLGLSGVLLGQWRAGGTVRVRADGTVGATSPSLSGSLVNARLFSLPEGDTAELLTLLQAVEPERHEAVELESGAEADRAVEAQDGTLEFASAETDDEPDMADEAGSPPVQGHVDVPAGQPERIGSTPSLVDDHFLDRPAQPAAGPVLVTQNMGVTTDERRLRGSIAGRVTTTNPPDQPTGAAAQVGESEPAPLHLQVLGRIHLTWRELEPADVIDVLAPRQREILVYLALHRDGSRREALTAALWPDAPGDRPYNSFHATLSQLRRSLRKATGGAVANITANDDGHYGLDQSLLTVDLWQLQDALRERHQAPTAEAKLSGLRRVAELYQGDLAASIAADWIDAPREALRRDVLDALSALIRSVGDDNPEQTLALLEQARGLDPYNEAVYRDLMRTQARLGQYDSVPRTLSLLTSSLADLDQRPTNDTIGLADFLRRPRNRQQHAREAS